MEPCAEQPGPPGVPVLPVLPGVGMALYFQLVPEPVQMREELAAQRPGRLPLPGRVLVAEQTGELVLAPPGLRQLLGQGGLELSAGRLGARLGDGVGADEAAERPDRRGELPQHRCDASQLISTRSGAT